MSVFAANPADPSNVRLAAVEAAVTAMSQQLAGEATARAAAIAALAGQRAAGDAAGGDALQQEIAGRELAVQHALDLIAGLAAGGGGGGGGGTPIGANLAAISVLATEANKLLYWTGEGEAALSDITSFARNLIAAEDDTEGREKLGLGTIATRPSGDFAAIAGANFAGRVTAKKSIVTDGPLEFTGPYVVASPAQVIGRTGTAAGGLTIVGYGNNNKGLTISLFKTRSDDPNAVPSTACVAGDRVVNLQIGAATGSDYGTGHIVSAMVIVDGDLMHGGETNGKLLITTGTGLRGDDADPAFPNRYADMPFILANRYQQCWFPGGRGDWLADSPGPGESLRGILIIGPGGWNDDNAAIRFQLANSILLATKVAGTFEVDNQGRCYFTDAAVVRRQFRMAEMVAPTATPGAAAGAGAVASIVSWGENSCTLKITTGASSLAAGKYGTIALPRAFPTALVPTMTAADTNGGFVRNGWIAAGANRDLIEISATVALNANTDYLVNVNWNGR